MSCLEFNIYSVTFFHYKQYGTFSIFNIFTYLIKGDYIFLFCGVGLRVCDTSVRLVSGEDKAFNFDNFDDLHNSFLLLEYFIDFFL